MADDLPDAPWLQTAQPPQGADDLPDAPWLQPAAAGQEQPMGWGKVATQALQNTPQSAYNFGHDIYQAARHPVDTLDNLKNVGLGYAEKGGNLLAQTGMFPSAGHEHEQYADAVNKFFANRYGGMENFKKTLATDPVGFLGDLSAVLSGGETMMARMPGALGKIGEVAGAVRPFVDPLSYVSGAGTLVRKGAKEFAGMESGVGTAPLEEAFAAGREGGSKAADFRDNITGRAPLEDAVTEARGGVQQMRAERAAEYNKEMDKLRLHENQFDERDRILDFGKIDNAIEKAEEVQTFKGRAGTGPAQVLDPGADAVRSQMINQIEHWKTLPPADYHTVEGVDALKRQLRNTMLETQAGTPARTAASRIYGAVRQTIADYYPHYTKIMGSYERASNELNEVQRALSLGEKASVDTALRKLQSTLRDNVNTSFGYRAKLANRLSESGAPNLRAKLAGQALAPVMPRGLGRLALQHIVPALAGAVGAGHSGTLGGALAAGATLPFMSPRLMGEAAYGAGVARRYTRPVTAPIARSLRPLRNAGRLDEAMTASPYAP